MPRTFLKLLLPWILLGPTMSQASAEAIRLYAAGSLKAAMTDIARAFEARSSGRYVVETEFGASGLLRERIEKGEKAHVFASANMKHPQTLAAAGKAEGAVRMFARNQLCALAREGVAATSDTLLATMLSDHVRVGTSTPKADPSGDYAFRLFAKAEAVTPGAKARLESKALKLTGGADTAKAPEGRNQYGWVMSEAKADVFLTYCTNAVLAKKDTPSLQIIDVPATLAVGADYGMVVLAGGPDAAKDLAAFILGGEAQSIMRQYGFGAGSDVTK